MSSVLQSPSELVSKFKSTECWCGKMVDKLGGSMVFPVLKTQATSWDVMVENTVALFRATTKKRHD